MFVLTEMFFDEVVGVDVQMQLFISKCIGGASFVDGGVLHELADFLAALQDRMEQAVDCWVG